MGASSHHYRGALNEADALVEEIEAYLESKTVDGLSIPVSTIMDTQQWIEKCSNMIGRLDTLNRELVRDSSRHEEYQKAIDRLTHLKIELCNYQLKQSKAPGMKESDYIYPSDQ